MATFAYIAAFPLRHAGDCSLLGIGPDGALYVEEIYGDGWLAQHALAAGGAIIASADEQDGAVIVGPLPLPDDLTRPGAGWHTMALNFAGPRQRGLREPERVTDLVRPLAIDEKIALAGRFFPDVPPPMLLGLAESYVLAEATLERPHRFVVCRRVRIAFALPSPVLADDGLPYDYDTRVIYIAHRFDRTVEDPPALLDPAAEVDNARLHRPMDCLIAGDRLYVADGGEADRLSAVHVWQIEGRADDPSPDDLGLKKLYG